MLNEKCERIVPHEEYILQQKKKKKELESRYSPSKIHKRQQRKKNSMTSSFEVLYALQKYRSLRIQHDLKIKERKLRICPPSF